MTFKRKRKMSCFGLFDAFALWWSGGGGGYEKIENVEPDDLSTSSSKVQDVDESCEGDEKKAERGPPNVVGPFSLGSSSSSSSWRHVSVDSTLNEDSLLKISGCSSSDNQQLFRVSEDASFPAATGGRVELADSPAAVSPASAPAAALIATDDSGSWIDSSSNSTSRSPDVARGVNAEAVAPALSLFAPPPSSGPVPSAQGRKKLTTTTSSLARASSNSILAEHNLNQSSSASSRTAIFYPSSAANAAVAEASLERSALAGSARASPPTAVDQQQQQDASASSSLLKSSSSGNSRNSTDAMSASLLSSSGNSGKSWRTLSMNNLDREDVFGALLNASSSSAASVTASSSSSSSSPSSSSRSNSNTGLVYASEAEERMFQAAENLAEHVKRLSEPLRSSAISSSRGGRPASAAAVNPGLPLFDGFDQEFRLLERRQFARLRTMSFTAARSVRNSFKNRYPDVMPPDDSRVCLKMRPGDTSDYINASWISGQLRGSRRRYVSMQGPLKNTFADAWRLVWEQRCSVIVMLTREIEKGMLKCERYWPPSVSQTFVKHGHLSVRLISQRKIDTEVTERRMELRHDESGEVRPIVHFQYVGWPDHGIPPSTTPFLNLVRLVMKTERGAAVTAEAAERSSLFSEEQLMKMDPTSLPPLIVHCSAGIGRSGTFISVHSSMERWIAEEHEGKPDSAQTSTSSGQGRPRTVALLRYIDQMRHSRLGMVQTHHQLRFAYLALAEVASAKQ